MQLHVAITARALQPDYGRSHRPTISRVSIFSSG
jgi:hypothetical protein